MSLDVERIVAETFVRHVEQRSETESTNDLAMQLIQGGHTVFPLLTVAARQTNGRGRGQNKWWGANGGLTFTVAIDANEHHLPTRDWPKLSLTTGLSVCETLESLVPNLTVQLKWPNDVYLERRKVCGILVETVPNVPGLIVVGIGINVNNSFQEAPAELRPIATSLVDESRRRFDLTEVLIQQLVQLARCIDRVAAGGEDLAEAWRDRCMLEGRTLTITTGGHRLTGVCQGIDDEGALLVQCEGGVQRCVAGVVSQIL